MPNLNCAMSKSSESQMLKMFDVAKKPADSADDIWRASQGSIPKNIVERGGPFVMGPLMLFIHLVEGMHGYYDTIEALNDETIKQRKSKIAVGVSTCMLAGAGIGISSAYLLKSGLSTLAVSSAAMAVFPALMPGLLCAIYSMRWAQKIYTLQCAIDEEELAKSEYLKYRLHGDYSVEQEEALEKKYIELRQERLKAEREVAFATIEVLCSMLVTASVIIGSVATCGALPAALAITGVIIATLSKFFEQHDDAHENTYTRKLRNFFFKPAPVLSNDVELMSVPLVHARG